MHRNAPLTPEGRLRLCRRIEDGWTVAAAAESMNISRQTAQSGGVGTASRESSASGIVEPAPAIPHQTPTKVNDESSLCAVATARARPPRFRAGVPASTVHRSGTATVCVDSRTSTAERDESSAGSRPSPGELVHVDVKKQAKIPGGGWRVNGTGKRTRTASPAEGVGYAFIHSAIDAHRGWPIRRSMKMSRQ